MATSETVYYFESVCVWQWFMCIHVRHSFMVRQRGIAQVRRELIQSILNSDVGRLSNGLWFNR